MTEHTFEAPWPPKILWPNGGHGNRYAVNDARKKASTFAQNGCSASGLSRNASFKSLSFVCHQGGNVTPDDDNMVAALKSYRDGIADWLHMNDREMNHKWTLTFGPKVKHGKVVITVEVEDLLDA